MLDTIKPLIYHSNTMPMVKIQVPIDKDIRDGLDKRAKALGFDSIQAYIRFWAKAEVDGRQPDFDEDTWGQPSPTAARRLNKDTKKAIRDHKAGILPTFTNAEDMAKHLEKL